MQQAKASNVLIPVSVNCEGIRDWETFHSAFSGAFGFPPFYGRNRNAWIDCMTRLDEEFSVVRVLPGDLVLLNLDQAGNLKQVAPEILAAVLEMASFVNWRRVEMGSAPILVVACYA